MPSYGIMFHHFYDGKHPRGQGAISAQDLADIITHVGREHILPADEWMRRVLHNELRGNEVCLTFDDALRCQFDIALPVLREFGLTAFWFVYSSVFQGNIEPLEIYRHFRTTAFSSVEEFYQTFFQAVTDEHKAAVVPQSYLAGFPFYTDDDRMFRYLRDVVLGVERYNDTVKAMIAASDFDTAGAAQSLWMKDEHLQMLGAEGHVVGMHSYTHPTCLAGLPLKFQEVEYRKNFDHLAEVLGENPVCMSHPCNSYTPDTLALLDRLGLKMGFRANMENLSGRSRFELPREDHANLMKTIRS
jgi:peptidoglycan/xylan/chitin deacetylase (PgdA/CDA1 family)